jgi:two-component system response regulator NreC
MRDITLLLVDDHDIVRMGLRSFLEPQDGIRVVGEASNGAEALARAAQLKPDIVLMDISMPDMDGLQATRRLRKECPSTHVLALTIHDDKHYFMEMMAAGASGYLTKHAAPDELMAAIHAVAGGQMYLQSALARWLLEDYQRLAADSAAQASGSAGAGVRNLDVLTTRERQVLELIAQACSNAEIGRQLGLSHKTIARHRERIMSRLDLHSRTELVKFAIRTGLVSLE